MTNSLEINKSPLRFSDAFFNNAAWLNKTKINLWVYVYFVCADNLSIASE